MIAARERPRVCVDCGTELAESLLVCPACHGLVHRQDLERLADEAKRAEAAGDLTGALAAWRSALDLLPAASRQANVIAERVAALREKVDERSSLLGPRAASGPKAGTRAARILAPLGAAGLLLWKAKAILALVATKGKLLLLGLGKASTMSTLLLSLGLYWAAWGWPLALGLLLSIYVHEMGHVAALTRYGMKASAPMFIPGVGALVRLRQRPVDAREDAAIGLAGPLWGLGAALVAYVIFRITDREIFAALAKLGAWINLFNLLPIWQLDGGRAFRALGRGGRLLAAAALAVAFLASREGLLLLLLLTAGLRAFGEAPAASDRRALVEYLVLVGALTALAALPLAVG